MPLPSGKAPFRETHRFGAWRVLLRSETGLVRDRLEDAWRVVPALRFGRRIVHALAVFDGVGGVPHGQDAAWAAADALEDAARGALGLDDLLDHLQPSVLATGGATTAVVVFLDPEDPGSGGLACVGDSSAYTLDLGGRLQRLSPRDAAGANRITDYLGHEAMQGHVRPFRLRRGAPLLLCTDGVDGVVPAAALENLLAAPEGALEAELDLLFEAVADAGAPDNATLLLAVPVA